MKKTLIVCDRYPLPEPPIVGGNIRTMNFFRFFKQYGTVDLAYIGRTKASGADAGLFAAEYPLTQLEYPKHVRGRLRMLLKGLPYPVREYEPGSESALLSAIEGNNYDYLVIRYVINSSWVFKLKTRVLARVIMDIDDLISESLYPTFFDPTKRFDKKLLRAVNRRLLKAYEKRVMAFGAVTFCSELDLRKMAPHCLRNNAAVVPNVYADTAFANHDFGEGYLNPNTLLFVGSLYHKPNAAGLLSFINEVYPYFREAYPDARLLIVGHGANESLGRISQESSNIEIHTNVPDIKPFYQRCRAVIVPLSQGGGTRLKILEAALAMRPVLSTSKGAEGLDLDDGTHLYLFSDYKEFLLKYGTLSSRSTYDSVVKKARKEVEAKYTTKGFNEAMGKVMSYLDRATT